MVVLFTGQSGVGVRSGMAKLARFVARRRETAEPLLLSLEDLMTQTAQEAGYLAESTLPELPKPLLLRLWGQAVGRLLQKVEAAAAHSDIFIHLHACWYHQLVEEFTTLAIPQEIEKLAPTRVLCIIDDVFDVFLRLMQDGRLVIDRLDRTAHPWEYQSQTAEYLRLILEWREREIMLSQLYARSAGLARAYVVAAKHSLELLYNLIYAEELPRVYLSHPITEPRRLLASNALDHRNTASAFIDSVNQCAAAIRDQAAVFEPTTIDEYRIRWQGSKVHLADRWPIHQRHEQLFWTPFEGEQNEVFGPADLQPQGIDDQGGPIRAQQLVKAVIDRVREQINSRDHALVEQSNALMVWRPMFRGVPSRGAEEEIEHMRRLCAIPDSEPGFVGLAVYPEDSKDYCAWELGQCLTSWYEEGILVSETGPVSDRLTDELTKEAYGALTEGNSQDLFGSLEPVLRRHRLRLRPPKANSSALASKVGVAQLNEWKRTKGVETLRAHLEAKSHAHTMEEEHRAGSLSRLHIRLCEEYLDPKDFAYLVLEEVRRNKREEK